jgi:hypothetical protein
MKNAALLILMYIIGLNSFAERTTTILKNTKWYVSSDKPVSISDFKNRISEFRVLEDLQTSNLPEENQSISTLIDLQSDQNGKLMISIEKANRCFDVWFDGQKTENLLNNEDFLMVIDNNIETDELLLTLTIKPGQKIDTGILYSIVNNITLVTLSGVVISWLTPQKDAYFGCAMLQIHVLNTLEKDVDGKLIARILNSETLDMIAENNNCAFARSGTEISIYVIFPDTESVLPKGKYIAEVVLVDKEKNEEIVDQLSVPIEIK